jgi:hypothetical protein
MPLLPPDSTRLPLEEEEEEEEDDDDEEPLFLPLRPLRDLLLEEEEEDAGERRFEDEDEARLPLDEDEETDEEIEEDEPDERPPLLFALSRLRRALRERLPPPDFPCVGDVTV